MLIGLGVLSNNILAHVSPKHLLKQLKRRLGELGEQNLPVAVKLWNGEEYRTPAPARIQVTVREPRALLALTKPTLCNLARSYVEEKIDLAGDMRSIIELVESLCRRPTLGQARERRGIKWRRHSKSADQRAISYHYDVSNDFYKLWLDQELVYSCAYFKREHDSLGEAQQQKLDHICRKLDLQRGERFLDIGCGWGGLILWAAQRYRVRAVGITLSRRQYDYASAQIRNRGLQGRCEVRLMDYRDIPETEHYDKIASVGMFEHVGIKNLPLYFGKIYRLLKPGGLVMNHGITSMGMNSVGLGRDIGDFIDEYVFPGGELTYLSRVIEAMALQRLECWDAECLRPHYVRTLWHWVSRLEAKKREAVALVGEKKFRIWQIYMAGSAWAFERGWLSVYQLLAGKAESNGRLCYPLTREHVYANEMQQTSAAF